MLGIFHYTIPQENCTVISIQIVKFANKVYLCSGRLNCFLLKFSDGLVSKKSRDHSIFALCCSKLYGDTNSTECLIQRTPKIKLCICYLQAPTMKIYQSLDKHTNSKNLPIRCNYIVCSHSN